MSVAGTSLPGGRYRIDPEENAAICGAVGAEVETDGRAHPIFYYIATQVGMGISVEDLLSLCDFDVSEGPLMTGSIAWFAGELRVDTDYVVQGEIVSLVRKPSRTFGAVDLLSFRLVLADTSGTETVECINEWVLPRRDGVTE